jgi:hypothetical protein
MSPDLKLFQFKVFISAAAATTALNLQFNLHLKFLITILNSRNARRFIIITQPSAKVLLLATAWREKR